MTTSQPLHPPLFGVGEGDDEMEIASDVDRRDEIEDIDIDFELTTDQPHDSDNDYVIEDAKSDVEQDMVEEMIDVENDDLMQDDELEYIGDNDVDRQQPSGQLVDEGFEHPVPDNGISVLEINLEEDFLGSDSIEASGKTHPERTSLRPEILQRQSSDIIATIPDQESTVDVRPENMIEEIADNSHTAVADSDRVAPNADSFDTGVHEAKQEVMNKRKVIGPEGLVGYRSETKVVHDENHQQGLHNPEDDLEASEHRLHPTTLEYHGLTMSLFPPSYGDTSGTYFLQDESLAEHTISNLFGVMRGVLADSVTKMEILELEFPDLGLRVTDDSSHASTTTLLHLLELHVNLLAHDGIDKPGPLRMKLTARTGFTKRVEDLSAAVAEGKGISQVPYWDNEDDRSFGSAASDEALTNEEYHTRGVQTPSAPFEDDPELFPKQTSQQPEDQIELGDPHLFDTGNLAPNENSPEGLKDSKKEDTQPSTVSEGELDLSNPATSTKNNENKSDEAPYLLQDELTSTQPRVGEGLHDGVEDDGDLINDDEEGVGENHDQLTGSSGSSTLRGDEPGSVHDQSVSDEKLREEIHVSPVASVLDAAGQSDEEGKTISNAIGHHEVTTTDDSENPDQELHDPDHPGTAKDVQPYRSSEFSLPEDDDELDYIDEAEENTLQSRETSHKDSKDVVDPASYEFLDPDSYEENDEALPLDDQGASPTEDPELKPSDVGTDDEANWNGDHSGQHTNADMTLHEAIHLTSFENTGQDYTTLEDDRTGLNTSGLAEDLGDRDDIDYVDEEGNDLIDYAPLSPGEPNTEVTESKAGSAKRSRDNSESLESYDEDGNDAKRLRST